MKSKFVSLMAAAAVSCFFGACSGDNSSSTGPGDLGDENLSSAEEQGENPSSEENSSSSANGTGEEQQDPTNVSSSSVANSGVVTYKYYGAELSGKEHFTYGKFEAKMKMVSFPGTVSSMFTYYDNSYILQEEPWNEIDIEVLGNNKTKWQSNLITREASVGKAKQSSEIKYDFGFDATEDFHKYVLIWTPEYIAWEIDDVEVRRTTVGDAHPTSTHDQVEFMTYEQSLRFNLWASKSAAWTGSFTGDELADGPIAQEIEYVKVYSLESDGTFKELWTDEFEGSTLNSTHWSTGNWNMEKVDLRPQNVVVEDGKCKLLISREAQ